MTQIDNKYLQTLEARLAHMRTMPQTIAKQERHKFNVKNLQEGSFLQLWGKTWKVIGTGEYAESWEGKTYVEHELMLFCLETGETSYLSWEHDEKLKVYFIGTTDALELSEVGLTARELLEIYDAEEGTIRFRGKAYSYVDSYDQQYTRTGGDGTEKVMLHRFDNGNEFIAINEWYIPGSRSAHQVFLGQEIAPTDVLVLVAGGH